MTETVGAGIEQEPQDPHERLGEIRKRLLELDEILVKLAKERSDLEGEMSDVLRSMGAPAQNLEFERQRRVRIRETGGPEVLVAYEALHRVAGGLRYAQIRRDPTSEADGQ